MKITILAFNFGPTKSFTNGPGMSLYVFCKSLVKHFDIDLFTDISAEITLDGLKQYSSKDIKSFKRSLKTSEIIHHWSGLTPSLFRLMKMCRDKKVILGPNLLDCVEIDKERLYLNKISFHKLLSVNDRLKYNIAFNHDIHHQKIETLIVGPDEDMWQPSVATDNFVLWKGNSKHKVKDINFALKLKNKLNKYNFNIMGYPKPYNYLQHIDIAKRACLYVNTSISETKSQTLMESWASGVPSVTHPKVYLHGVNYETGIITNKTLDDYSEAITEIMENKILRNNLSDGAHQYVKDNLSEKSLIFYYYSIIK